MPLRNLILAGVLTWVIVALPHVRQMQPLWAVCYVAFLVFFLISALRQRRDGLGLLLIAAQSVLALVCCALEPSGMQPVLLVLVAAHLGHAPQMVAITIIVVQTALLGLIAAERAR